MKIEKVNDNQIRCTLTREDLDSRHLKLSELAYGTEKAKSLFREMMEKASYEFGFDAEDIPLMIEAVPLTADSILLIVTKVEYPEELDTRFSHFSEDMDPDDFDMDSYDDAKPHPPTAADDILSLFSKAKEAAARIGKSADASLPDASQISVPVDITKLFVFSSLDHQQERSHTGRFQQGLQYPDRVWFTGRFFCRTGCLLQRTLHLDHPGRCSWYVSETVNAKGDGSLIHHLFFLSTLRRLLHRTQKRRPLTRTPFALLCLCYVTI